MKHKIQTRIAGAIALLLGSAASLNAATYGNGSTAYSVDQASNPQVWTANHTASAWTHSAIQSAMNNATVNGGTVPLSNGTYWSTNQINLKSKVRVRGASETGTIIKRTGSVKPSRLFYTSNSTWRDITFEKLTVHGNNAISDMTAGHSSADISTSGFDISGTNSSQYGDRIRLQDVTIVRCKNGFIGGGFSNQRILWCNISENGSDGTNSSLHHNYYSRRIARLYFYKTDIKGSPRGTGLKLWGGTSATSSESKDLEVANCWLDNNERSNTEPNGMVDVRLKNSTFHNADFNSGSASAILLGTGSQFNCKYIDIVNNKIQNNDNYGINAESPGSHINIKGNYSVNNKNNYNIQSSNTSCDYNTSL